MYNMNGWPPFPPFIYPPQQRDGNFGDFITTLKEWTKYLEEEEKKKKDKSPPKSRTYSALEVFALLTALGPFVSIAYAYAVITVMHNMTSLLSK